jgi:hypothetical protein
MVVAFEIEHVVVVVVVEAHESPFLKLISWQPSNQSS